jgi:hypothetical protein
VIVHDPLYGRFELPGVSRALLQSPEFRRLSEVRLLNTISPSLATLGEIKRYSHTLGVVYLANQWISAHRRNFSEPELRALEAATILHDVGTPPFGHLFEYILREASGWHHEAVVNKILRGQHAPENTAHQFFAGRTPQVYGMLRECNVELPLLTSILDGAHPLSRLLFGSIDFDNLDNVARMAWALGIAGGAEMAKALTSSVSVAGEGALLLPQAMRERVRQWLGLRRSVYEILVHDWPTLAAQATLTRAMLVAIGSGALGPNSWSMTDDELLTTLRQFRESKDLVNNEYLGVLPTGVLCVQLSQTVDALPGKTSVEIIARIEMAASEAGIARPLGFVLRDKGMIEKKLIFLGEDGESWSEGATSTGTFLYVFSRAHGKKGYRAPGKLLTELSRTVGFDEGRIIRVIENSGSGTAEAQGRLV